MPEAGNAEFNARMQAASVVLVSTTVQAAIDDTLKDPDTQARLSALSAASVEGTQAYLRAAQQARTDPDAFVEACQRGTP